MLCSQQKLAMLGGTEVNPLLVLPGTISEPKCTPLHLLFFYFARVDDATKTVGYTFLTCRLKTNPLPLPFFCFLLKLSFEFLVNQKTL